MKNKIYNYEGLPKECSICGREFYGRDATEGKTGPIICLGCWSRMATENNSKKDEPEQKALF